MFQNIDAQFYLSPNLNGTRLNDIACSELLSEDQTIIRFYACCEPPHGFVVFQTEDFNTFRCHLTGTPKSLSLETCLFEWKPKMLISHTSISVPAFKLYLRGYFAVFGEYETGRNDCVVFASNLSRFLANQK
jgi:hypothetical protein